jgi:hypothetical protein
MTTPLCAGDPQALTMLRRDLHVFGWGAVRSEMVRLHWGSVLKLTGC